jgi:hypothetical protein
MVQALAFAEIFGGLILAYAGYKGYSPAEVVSGKVTKESPTLGLGSSSSSGSASAEAVPAGAATAPSPTGLSKSELPKNSAFGPSPGNNPSFGASAEAGGFNALSPTEKREAEREGARG